MQTTAILLVQWELGNWEKGNVELQKLVNVIDSKNRFDLNRQQR